MMNVLLAAGATGTQHSARLLAALLPLLILAVVFDVFCLIDLVRAKSVRYLPKVVWAIIIVLMSVPLGALLYLFVGRDPNQGSRARG